MLKTHYYWYSDDCDRINSDRLHQLLYFVSTLSFQCRIHLRPEEAGRSVSTNFSCLDYYRLVQYQNLISVVVVTVMPRCQLSRCPR